MNHPQPHIAHSCSRALKATVAFALAVCATIPGYVLIKYGIHFSDEPYQILNAMDYRESPFSSLASFLYGIFGEITGFSWLAFRYLALTLANLSIFVAGIYLYSSSGKPLWSGAVTAVALLLSGLSRMLYNLFGWDCISTLLIVLTLMPTLAYIRKSSPATAVAVAGALTALAILARLPNAAVIVAVSVIIIFGAPATPQRGRLRAAMPFLATYISAVLIVSAAVVTLLFGSPAAFVDSVAHNILTQHSLKSLLVLYAVDGSRVVMIIATMWVVIRTTDRMADAHLPWPIKAAIFIVIGLILFILLHFHSSFVSTSYYAEGLLIAVTVRAVYPSGHSANYRARALTAVAVVMFGFAAAAGSNIGVRKFLSWPLLPISVALLMQTCTLRRIALYGAITLLPLLAQAGVECQRESFLDAGPDKATVRIESGAAKGLYTTSWNEARLNEITGARESLPPGTRTVVLGENPWRFLYEYFFAGRSTFAPHEWRNTSLLDSDSYMKWVRTLMENRGDSTLALVCLHREDDIPSRMEVMLDNSNAERLRYDSFTLYVYPPLPR